MTVPSLCSPVVGRLEPYVPGEQPRIAGLVKLNTNENPYPPSPRAVAAIEAAAREGLQLYPDPQSLALRETIATHHGLEGGQVFVGNGSDEVLAHAFEPYFTTKSRGTGLGLAMVKKIVDEHGGDVRLGNRDGSGAEVRIRLRLAETNGEH